MHHHLCIWSSYFSVYFKVRWLTLTLGKLLGHTILGIYQQDLRPTQGVWHQMQHNAALHVEWGSLSHPLSFTFCTRGGNQSVVIRVALNVAFRCETRHPGALGQTVPWRGGGVGRTWSGREMLAWERTTLMSPGPTSPPNTRAAVTCHGDRNFSSCWRGGWSI